MALYFARAAEHGQGRSKRVLRSAKGSCVWDSSFRLHAGCEGACSDPESESSATEASLELEAIMPDRPTLPVLERNTTRKHLLTNKGKLPKMLPRCSHHLQTITHVANHQTSSNKALFLHSPSSQLSAPVQIASRVKARTFAVVIERSAAAASDFSHGPKLQRTKT